MTLEEKDIQDKNRIARQGVLYGIDIDDNQVQMSIFQSDMLEPETISTQLGMERFEIPLCLFHPDRSQHWYYGDKAKEYRNSPEGIFVEDLWNGCLEKREIMGETHCYSYQELLIIFFQRLLRLGIRSSGYEQPAGIVFTVNELDDVKILELMEVSRQLNIPSDRIYFQDYKESFASFVVNRGSELWARESFLFYYKGNSLNGYQLMVNRKKMPFAIRVKQVLGETLSQPDGELSGTMAEQMDMWFALKIDKLFGTRMISSVFLIGPGFENGWMKESLRLLCHGKRVFQGRNLFTKGACYACMEYMGWKERLGEYQSSEARTPKLRIPVTTQEGSGYISAQGDKEAWYRAGVQAECLLDNCRDIKIEILMPEGRLREETLQLVDLPQRPNLATKVQVRLEFESSTRAKVTVTDLGLGELFSSSGMKWEKEIEISS